MEYSASVREYLSLVFRKLKFIIIFTLIFTILAGALGIYEAGYFGLKKTAEKKISASLQGRLETQQQLASVKKYYAENSVYMNINSQDYRQASYVLTVIPENGTLTDFQINTVTSYYTTVWDSSDLIDALGLDREVYKYSFYVGEVVKISPRDNSGVMSLTAIANDEEESSMLLKAAGDFIKSLTEEASKSTYPHKLVVSDYLNRPMTSNAIAVAQAKIYTDIKDAESQISTIKSQINEANGDGSASKPATLLKYVFIGLLAGLILSVFFVITAYAVKKRTISSVQLRRDSGAECLGTAVTKENCKSRASCRLCRERIYDSEEDALDNIADNVLSSAVSGSILLTSSLKSFEGTEAEKVKEKLEKEGCSVVLLPDICGNRDAAEALKESENVVLLEKIDKTGLSGFEEAYIKIKTGKKNLLGFVMV